MAMIVQNMPGADGLAVANYMAQRALRDGTVIALTNRELVMAPLLGSIEQSSIQYDPVRWSRLFEQLFRVDKWSVCRG